MRISELASITGNTPETIRYYEKIGLLPPACREANNYRSYGRQHASRLVFIRHCRNLDIGLEEIRSLLTALDERTPASAECAHALIDRHLKEVDERIKDLQELKGHLLDLAEHCRGEHGEGEMCGIIAELSERSTSPCCPHGCAVDGSRRGRA